MKIAHVSDIHWRGFQRHEEYTDVHVKLVNKLRELKPDLILCTGDIFHTKTQGITPEFVDKLVWSFRELASVAPFHTILGNHDGNLANESRQDAISPIVEAMRHLHIKLYKQSGVYPLVKPLPKGMVDVNGEHQAINFCNFSCFDKEGWSKVKPVDGAINIALFHGSITGCVTDMDWAIKHGEEELGFFAGYDFALLGDIHKQQFMAHRRNKDGDLKPYIGYPGSLIQQNFGEDEIKGFYLWDIRTKDDWSVDFHAIENLFPYVTIPWLGDVKSTIAAVELDRGDKAFQKGSRVRIAADQTISQVEKRQLFQEIRERRLCSELVYKTTNNKASMDNIKTGSVSVQKTSLRNDAQTLIKLYREYAKNHLAKMNLTEAQLLEGDQLILSYLKRFNDLENDVITRDVFWTIKSLEFSNLFCYGADNKIDFTKLSGIVGIFGNNTVGKSSIVSSLCYGLFNKTDRESVKSAEIINRNKRSANCKVVMNVGGLDYVINRDLFFKEVKKNGVVVQDDKVTTKLTFERHEKDGQVIKTSNENDDSRTDTDKVIRKLIGSKEDFMMTALSSQYAPNNFIAMGATQRKSVLNKFLDIDIFEKLHKFANDDCANLNARTARFQSVTWESNILKLEKELESKNGQLTSLDGEIKDYRSRVDALKIWVADHLKQIDQCATRKSSIDKLEREIARSRAELTTLNSNLAKNKSGLESNRAAIMSLREGLQNLDIVELKAKKAKLDELSNQVSALKHQQQIADVKLGDQKKSVRKLELVPCGDSFPTCRYIKDSHVDKTLVDAQQATVNQLTNELLGLDGLVQELLSEKIEMKLKDHASFQAKIEQLNAKLSSAFSEDQILEFRVSSETKTLVAKERELELLQNNIGDTSSDEEAAERSKALDVMVKHLSKLEDGRTNLLMLIGSIKTKISSLTQEMEECKTILEQLQVHNSVLEAFSKYGIPAMVLQTQLPAINDELDKITSSLGFKLTLETEVNSNTLEVFIESNKPKRVIELCSGAEMALASLAIRVALTTLSSLPKSDVLIVDEGFGSLDEENVPKCLQLLALLKNYFRLVLIVSHIPQIKEAAERIIEIANNGLESRVLI